MALDWEVLGLLSFEEHLQAIASLDTVAGQHLELYYTDQGGTERILLRVSCVSCPSQHVHEVTSLEQLGQLLPRLPPGSPSTRATEETSDVPRAHSVDGDRAAGPSCPRTASGRERERPVRFVL